MPGAPATPLPTADWLASQAATGRPYVLLEATRADAPLARTLRFVDARSMLTLRAGEPVAAFFEALEAHLARGHWLAGWIGYEAGYAFEPALADRLARLEPGTVLARLGVFGPPESTPPGAGDEGAPPADTPPVRLRRAAMTRGDYRERIARIHAWIARGDTYQVNFTFPLELELLAPAHRVYLALRRRQRVAWGACLFDGERHVVSLSPELFLARDGGRIASRPMKGTAARADDPALDAARRHALARDPKNRAENVMIVDMIRNDLGRVARPGSVTVPRRFTVETYETVHQMTSTVQARLRPGVSWGEILRSTFPCASVTGAPRVRTMQFIAHLEAQPRGVYTGAIGFIAPDGTARLNVAIRTIEADVHGRARMGVGSGIVFDSDADAEYDECLLKARFALGDGAGADPDASDPSRRDVSGGAASDPSRRAASGTREAIAPAPTNDDALARADLVETLLVVGLNARHLDAHRRRMARSARELERPFDANAFDAAVRRAVSRFADRAREADAPRGAPRRLRVRVLLSPDGRMRAEATPAPTWPRRVRVALWPVPVPSQAPWRRHKSTWRPAFARAGAWIDAGVADEVIFVNERGEVTEGTVSTLFVERDGVVVTPALECGVLAGTTRARALERGRCIEGVVTPSDLRRARRLWVANAVRGIARAVPVESPATAAGVASAARRGHRER